MQHPAPSMQSPILCPSSMLSPFLKSVVTNGDCYRGEWENHERNGQGKLDCGSRGAFRGTFQLDSLWDGEMEGFMLGNGDRYTGNVLAGKRNGEGMLWLRTGGIFRGSFRNDRTYEGKMEPNAVFKGKIQ